MEELITKTQDQAKRNKMVVNEDLLIYEWLRRPASPLTDALKPLHKNLELRAGEPKMTSSIKRAIKLAEMEAEANAEKADIDHLLLGVYETRRDIFSGSGITRERVLEAVTLYRSQSGALDKYGINLLNFECDPVIGRQAEIERLMHILARRTKNNPALIGEPGVGKTAVVYGFVQRLKAQMVPKQLLGLVPYAIDLAALVAGTGMQGELEARVMALLDEIKRRKNIVLFVDELHRLVGAGGQGSQDASNILKPALARGDLRMIGATTLNEFRNFIEKDGALERRFQAIFVAEPTVEVTLDILKGIAPYYEKFHNVEYSKDALEAAATLSVRYIPSRQLPDKAVDLIDESAAKVSIEGGKKVTREHIAEAVARWTGIPITTLMEDESERLVHLERDLHQFIIGQEKAVSVVSGAIRRARAGLAFSDKPTGVFLFIGPTGVGKTELAKALAILLYNSEEALIRIDMGEYQQEHSVMRLFGAPPSYVGYEEGGQLTEAVRRRPYSIILLDEIEKAHKHVFGSLLQLMDDGRMTDGQGRTVDFKNTIIIMTSNIDGPASGYFRPEFINRLDDIVDFHALNETHMEGIVKIQLGLVTYQVKERGTNIKFTQRAVDYLARMGFDPKFGARPLRRAVQTYLLDPLSLRLFNNKVGDLTVDYVAPDLCFYDTKTKKLLG